MPVWGRCWVEAAYHRATMKNILRLAGPFSALCLGAFAIGCADPAAEEVVASSDADVVTRVDGSATGSGYAKAGTKYLSVRRVDVLAQVGALEGVLGTVADRVDGIIANKPADGRISIDELVKMEQPAIFNTLFPEEKAALPALWALLETTNAAPKNAVPVGTLPALTAQDQSVPAGTLSTPASLAIAQLPAALQQPARRVELTYDADGDAQTIARTDLDQAIANPAPYLPAEITAFEQIKAQFTARSVSSFQTKVDLPKPDEKVTTLTSLGAAKIVVTDSVVVRETRSLWHSNANYPEGRLQVSLSAEGKRTLAVETNTPGDRVVFIHEDSENEAVMDAQPKSVERGNVTFEIWRGGKRIESTRVKFADSVTAESRTQDLSQYADYVATAGGAPLFRNVVTASERGVYNAGRSWEASFLYGATATPNPPTASGAALSRLATPTGIVAGRYELTAGTVGKVRVDVSPTGVMIVTRLATNTTVRAPIHTWGDDAKYDAHFNDRLRVLVNGRTGELKIFFDGGSTVLDATLRADDRVG